jgi:hypothetical protein
VSSVLYRTAGFAGDPVTIAADRDKGYLDSALDVLADRRNSADARGEILSACAGRACGSQVRVLSGVHVRTG